jgi:putative transposase
VNTDQGVQFTSTGFVDELEAAGVRISMDGKGRFLDNIFIERLWRSLKYEEVFTKAYGSVIEARRGIGGWLSFYNDERPHQALGYLTPRAVFTGEACAPAKSISCGTRSRRPARSLPIGVRIWRRMEAVDLPSRLQSDHFSGWPARGRG